MLCRPALTPDGNCVAFQFINPGSLTPEAVTNGVYLRKRSANTTTLMSKSNSGLVATDAATTHLEVIAELPEGQRRSLEEQVLDLLAGGVVRTRAKLRAALAVQNERLGAALESLERAGRLCRTPTGWRRLD